MKYIVFISLFLYFENAYAYLDGGVLTFILQMIAGAFAFIITVASLFFDKIKYFFKKVFRKL
jgi:hypothetical protein|tara:strand:- start:297 stop:482 length:186 start_codon:yes stop_codon:yes gene_type:complete